MMSFSRDFSKFDFQFYRSLIQSTHIGAKHHFLSINSSLKWNINTETKEFFLILSKSHCFKITQNVAFAFWHFGIFTNFCPIKIEVSGYTVWPQASGFQKLAKMDHFWHFKLTFVYSKCKRSSLRSQCWMLNETFSVIFNHRAKLAIFGTKVVLLPQCVTYSRNRLEYRKMSQFFDRR